MNTELFDLAAKYKAACKALDDAEHAYKAANDAMSAADNALGEAKVALVKALGKDGAVVLNDECFVSDGGYIKIRKLAGIGFDLAKQKPETDADGFIAWRGGDCPVDGKTMVSVRLRDGYVSPSRAAATLRWNSNGWEGDIVAYKVVDPAKPDQAKPEPEPETDADGFIVWKGGECPVPPGTIVCVTFRDGHGWDHVLPERLRWVHSNHHGDIVAYKVVG